jgi:hypothetical protein
MSQRGPPRPTKRPRRTWPFTWKCSRGRRRKARRAAKWRALRTATCSLAPGASVSGARARAGGDGRAGAHTRPSLADHLDSGQPYYYNVDTQESCWSPPPRPGGRATVAAASGEASPPAQSPAPAAAAPAAAAAAAAGAASTDASGPEGGPLAHVRSGTTMMDDLEETETLPAGCAARARMCCARQRAERARAAGGWRCNRTRAFRTTTTPSSTSASRGSVQRRQLRGADERATCAQVDVGDTVGPVKTREMFLFCANAKSTAVDRLLRSVSCGRRGHRFFLPFCDDFVVNTTRHGP